MITTTTRTQAMSITLKMPRCCPFLVSPPIPQPLAQGSVLLHYILSSAILKLLTYSELKTFLRSVLHKRLSPNKKQLPFSLQETRVMTCTFPPHTQSPMLCSQQVPVRFFRSENKFCCLSVCALRQPPELYFCRNPGVFCRQRHLRTGIFIGV